MEVFLEKLTVQMQEPTGTEISSRMWKMGNKKILIVEGDPDVRQGMHVRLEANHYETFFAADAPTSFRPHTRYCRRAGSCISPPR
jgi:hypothetical protein